MVDADTERWALEVEVALVAFRHLLVPYKRRTYCGAATFPVTTIPASATCHACLEALKAHEVELALIRDVGSIMVAMDPGATVLVGATFQTRIGRRLRVTEEVVNHGTAKAKVEVPVVWDD